MTERLPIDNFVQIEQFQVANTHFYSFHIKLNYVVGVKVWLAL